MTLLISSLNLFIYIASIVFSHGIDRALENLLLKKDLYFLANSTEPSMNMSDNFFQNVPLDSNKRTACSPDDPGFNWRGVVLRAPTHVMLAKQTSLNPDLVIPLCGLYLVTVADTFEHPGPKILTVIDDLSGEVYKGKVVKANPERTIPPPPLPRVTPSKNRAFSEYFNVNISDYVTLPHRPARYRIKIEYAGYQSNEVIITVVERP